jgi:hypothetical protein
LTRRESDAVSNDVSIRSLGRVMNLIEELRATLRMEVRGNSRGNEYLEAVIGRNDLELLQPLLTKHFGSAAKEPGKEAALPVDIRRWVDSMGGLRVDQAFYYKQGEGRQVLYAALWPWQSNPERITLKAGVALVSPPG